MLVRLLKIVLKVLGSVLFAVCVLLLVVQISASRREVQDRTAVAPSGGRMVQAGDAQVFIQEAGPVTGPAVLFVHGTGAWGEIWRQQLTDLGAAGYHAIAIDLPPFGYSERIDRAAYGSYDQGTRIANTVDALGLKTVTLVGHSFGGRATVEAAALLGPSRVTRLVLVDAALGLGDGTTPPAPASPLLSKALRYRPVRRTLAAATLTNPWLTKFFLSQLVSVQSAVTTERVAMLQQPLSVSRTTAGGGEWLPSLLISAGEQRYSTTTLSQFSEPTLVLWGESDSVTPLAEGRYIHRLIPSSTLSVIPGVGHIPHLEDPTAVSSALLEFLKPVRTK